MGHIQSTDYLQKHHGGWTKDFHLLVTEDTTTPRFILEPVNSIEQEYPRIEHVFLCETSDDDDTLPCAECEDVNTCFALAKCVKSS